MENEYYSGDSGDILEKEECLAHVIYETGRKQLLEKHLKNVAEFAEQICPLPELKNLSYLVGILHDIGKAGEENQDDFRAILKYGKKVHKHNLDHSTAGGRMANDLFKGSEAGRMVSTIVYSHHGVQDCIDLRTGQTLEEKRREKNIEYDLIQQRFFQIYDKCMLEEKFKLTLGDFKCVNDKIGTFLSNHKSRTCGNGFFFMGMYVRLLASILIDSDWTDTACFSEDIPLPVRLSVEKVQVIWKQSVEYFEKYLSSEVKKNPKNCSTLNEYRQEISDLCREASKQKRNLYRLTVPTGAGKTLSSLRFALHHAIEQKKQHIIYIAPFNSILEQNAQEIRNAVGNSEIILEHHCNVICEDEEKEREYRGLTETWDSPIILTSAVQILNTLFSEQKSCIRRMHSLCNSIIIFDEVQAFPVKCRELFNLAVNFLTLFCNTTVILCSATQPTLASYEENNICECIEMAGEVKKYMEIFKRTEIIDKTGIYPGGMEIADLKDFVLENIEVYKSILVIVNTTSCARNLFSALREWCDGSEYQIFHLSNNMCAKNKLDKLEEIKSALKEINNGKKVICVSTQLVEAGVNFSFGCVIRSKAGLDNIIQASGRCNRHKELEGLGAVYIIQMSKQAENLNSLPEIITAQNALQKVLDDYRNNPERFRGSLDSQEAIKAYYENYHYGLDTSETKFPVKDYNTTLVDLLGKDSIGCKQYKRSHNLKSLKSPFVQAFQTAGKEFEVISNEYKTNVVIEYDETAKRSIQKLESNRLNQEEQRKEMRVLQRYTVSISENKRNKLGNAIHEICDKKILVLSDGYYDHEIGVLDNPKMNTLMI